MDEITHLISPQLYCTTHVAEMATTRHYGEKSTLLLQSNPLPKEEISTSKIEARVTALAYESQGSMGPPGTVFTHTEEEYAPLAAAKGGGTNGGRQTGTQVQHNLPPETASQVHAGRTHPGRAQSARKSYTFVAVPLPGFVVLALQLFISQDFL